MNSFFQVIAGALVTLMLGLSLSKQGKDNTLLLSVAVCCMILAAAAAYLEPVMGLVRRLQQMGELDSDMLTILLKAVGIGLISQISVLICDDCGNAALGKAVQICASAAVLWLSIPLVTALMDLIQKIVEGL